MWCSNMCIEMFSDMCINMCISMSIDVRIDLSIRMPVKYQSVYQYVCRPLCTTHLRFNKNKTKRLCHCVYTGTTNNKQQTQSWFNNLIENQFV